MSAEQTPLVSIAMAVHNARRFLDKAIQSVLSQDYRGIELIICDNASTDGSSEACLAYAKADARVRYYRNPVNLGPMRNSIKAVDLCSGDFMMCAADHDVYHPRFISALLDAMLRDGSLVVVYPRTVLIDENDSPTGLVEDRVDTRGLDACRRFSKIIWEFEWGNLGYGLHRSAALKKVADFHKTIGPDHLIFAKISLLGAIAQVDEPLFFRRQNRPAENTMEMVRRQTSWFINSTSKALAPWTMLAYEHIKIVRDSDLSPDEKDVLLEDVRSCFTHRFGGLMRQEAHAIARRGVIVASDPSLSPTAKRDKYSELAELVDAGRYFFPDMAELCHFASLRSIISSAQPHPGASGTIPYYMATRRSPTGVLAA